MKRVFTWTAMLAAFIGLLPIPLEAQQCGAMARVSVASNGLQAYRESWYPAITPDGRYVAFASPASNLVAGDTNNGWDVFVKDRQTGQIRRVSVSSTGGQGNGDSYAPAISANGRFVAFMSRASTLVANDTNGVLDVFVHDRDTDGDGIFDETGAIRTVRVSVSSAGLQATADSGLPAISADGRYVTFESSASNLVTGDTNGLPDIFLRDRDTDGDGIFDETGAVLTRIVSGTGTANGASSSPVISGNGRYVAFVSYASNLVPFDFNLNPDIFVWDRVTGTRRRVSVSASGVQANWRSNFPAISADGRLIAFASDANNLVPGDTNGVTDVFVYDRDADEDGIFDESDAFSIKRVSVNTNRRQGNWDSGWFKVTISPEGRFAAFVSRGSNLVASDTNQTWDIFLHDLWADRTIRLSVSSFAQQANNWSTLPALAQDGRFIAFVSYATNLVSGDTNGWADVFVFQR